MAETARVEWTPKLRLKNLSSIAFRLREPFHFSVTVTNHERSASVSNCSEYLKFSALHFAPPSDRDAAILQFQGVDCQTLGALREAKPARISYLKEFRLDEQSADYLPPSLAPAVSAEDTEKARNAEAHGLSWREFQPGLVVKPESDSISVGADGVNTRLEIYARGDFNADRLEDILIRTDVSFSAGSYSGSRLFLLTRQSPHSRLTMLREYK
jgi:hypothetical protein